MAVLIIPLALGIISGRLSDWVANPNEPRGIRLLVGRLMRTTTPPTIWDWLYQAAPPFGSFLIVEFEDGSQIAGVFAEGSMALTSPEKQGVYLVSEWQLNDAGAIIG